MKPITLILSILISTVLPARANIDCIWSASNSGITLRYIASCGVGDQQFLDNFLKNVVHNLENRDRNFRILIVVNEHRLSFPDNELPDFISIGFDTLRMIDDNFISDYYFSKEDSAMGPKGGLNTYKSKNNPLDINATNKKASNQLGIKIMYNSGYRMNRLAWDELGRLILYASNNVAFIKEKQTKQTVRYNTNGWFVSINNIDPKIIEEQLNRKLIKKKPEPSFLFKMFSDVKTHLYTNLFMGFFRVAVLLHLFS